jgi:hypothetical protein
VTDTPTKRYRQVARQFFEYARSQNSKVVPQPASAEDLQAAEAALACRFPDSYRWFQLEFGELEHGPLDVYGVRRGASAAISIVAINLEERREGYPPLPLHLIAFSDSGGGDLCCFDTSLLENGECPVVWWDHEDDETQTPEPAAASFLDWLETEVRESATEAKSARFSWMTNVVGAFARDVFRNRPK